MKYLTVVFFTYLTLSTNVFAEEQERTPLGSATITVGDETASWPVWNCGKVVLAHQNSDADIRVDPNLKLVDLDSVVGLVIIFNDLSYTADLAGTVDVHNLNYSGTAATFNAATSAFGEADITVSLTCNP